jgi:uncharacterized membrane protein YccC
MQSGTWDAFRRALTRFEREKINPLMAARNTVGVILPLAIADALNQPALGLVVALGALNVAYSDGIDPYRIRGRRMLISTAFCSIAIALGGLTGRYQAMSILLAAAWAFSGGMLVALGTTAADIGIISLVTLVVFGARPLSPGQAAFSGLVACGGGLLQIGLSLLFWPARRYSHERQVLAEVYGQLGRLAMHTAAPGVAPLASDEFTRATQMLSALSGDHNGEAEAYNSLLSQAERIRLRLFTLARLLRRLRREEGGGEIAAVVDRFLQVSSQVLGGISRALEKSASVPDSPLFLAEADRIIEDLRSRGWPDASSFFLALVRDAAFQTDALAGQLRAAARVAERTDFTTPVPAAAPLDPATGGRGRLRNQMEVLRANLTFSSTAFRHALRLAVCVAIGDAIGRGFDWRRSYWIPMTIAIVLKPDFLSTFSRGALRFAGTFFGLVLSTALYRLLPAGLATDVLFAAVFTLLLRWLGPANYGILTMSVSALVVALLAGSGVAPRQVVLLRGLNTAVGGSLAMLAYGLWPTWERTQIGEGLARLLDPYRNYLRAVREAFVSGSKAERGELDRCRQNARVVRSNVEASADRLSVEPGATPEFLRRVAGLLASSHDFIHAVMTFEAAVVDEVRGHEGCVPALDSFFDQVELMLYFLSAALRGSPEELIDMTDMREKYRRLAECAGGSGLSGSLMLIETDRMTNALNTLREQVLPWARKPVTAGSS